MKRLLALFLCAALLCVPVSGAESEKLIALTFDDGPSGRYTRQLLDGLAEREVSATFLLCGYRMEQYPDLTARIAEEGHEIGLHGYSHKAMDTMCCDDIVRELEKSSALLPADCETVFLRPPGGMCSSCVRNAAKSYGLAILSWSVDPRDWAIRNAAAIEKEVLSHVRDGDVILLHDMSDSSVEAALDIVDALQEQGFRFVTVSELAQARQIDPVPGEVYRRFTAAES